MKRTLTALALGVSLLLASGGVGFAADLIKGWEAFLRDDYAKALREWRPLAEQGNAEAQDSLAWMYRLGKGVLQDDKEAMKWFRKSAEQGYAQGQYDLGWMYDNGYGVIQDNVYAHMWFNIAAAICMRLVLSKGKINVYTLAKNAGTSVEMIESNYAKKLPITGALVENLQSFGD